MSMHARSSFPLQVMFENAKINLSLQSNVFFVGIEAADLTSLLEQFEETQGNH